MKNYHKYLLIAAMVLTLSFANAQTLNFASLEGDKEYHHIVNVNMGAEFGMVYGVGYGYHIKTKLFHIVPTVEYSFPAGKTLFDDFKTRAGVQVNWFDFHHIQFNTRVQGVFRRYENGLVRMANFGSDMAGVVGYYRKSWFAAGEVGFDKAIITHFKHSQAYRDQYEGVADGWYEPAVGGNFYFGIQGGYSFKRHDISLRFGRLLTQDFKTSPMLPFYGQLGYNVKF